MPLSLLRSSILMRGPLCVKRPLQLADTLRLGQQYRIIGVLTTVVLLLAALMQVSKKSLWYLLVL
ncbi:hypothetical protein ORJ00_07970 [Rheinheimera baltica]|uniref:hypothetical protein n=1 Tax=Rheinheimera baltica TaxID=67576 RepID=UPI00273D439E|nr:hypothetical protein [Rheinheimera baltica]MDP5142671.1 hypothetical protein [Rheinheimera baltica]